MGIAGISNTMPSAVASAVAAMNQSQQQVRMKDSDGDKDGSTVAKNQQPSAQDKLFSTGTVGTNINTTA